MRGTQRQSKLIRSHQTYSLRLSASASAPSKSSGSSPIGLTCPSSSSYPSLPKVEDPPGEWVGALDERSPDLPSASRRKYGFNKGKSIHAEMRGIEWDADTMQPEP